MKSLRPKLTALGLTALLAAIVLLPPYLSGMQDGLLLGTLHTEPLPETAAEPSALPTEEKLALFCELYSDGVNLATVSQERLNPDAALVQKARAALKALHEAGLLPDASALSEAAAHTSCTIGTVADLNAPERFLRIAEWSLQSADSDGPLLDLTLDMETGLVYGFSYFSQGSGSLSLEPDTLPELLSAYLGVSWDDVAYDKDDRYRMTGQNGRVAYLVCARTGGKNDFILAYPDTSLSTASQTVAAAVDSEKYLK